jgi:hypothetical protein
VAKNSSLAQSTGVGCRLDGDACNLGVGDADGKKSGEGVGTSIFSGYRVAMILKKSRAEGRSYFLLKTICLFSSKPSFYSKKGNSDCGVTKYQHLTI